MALYTRDNKTFTPNQLKKMGIDDPEKLGFKVVQDVIPEHDSFSVKMVKTGRIVHNQVEYREEPLTDDERIIKYKTYAKAILNEVDIYIDCAVCDIMGFENRDAIGKYLVQGNPFYERCSSISIWIAECYITCEGIQEDVISGKRELPIVKDIIEILPVAPFLSNVDNKSLVLRYYNKKNLAIK